jgi:hypothetical protein
MNVEVSTFHKPMGLHDALQGLLYLVLIANEWSVGNKHGSLEIRQPHGPPCPVTWIALPCNDCERIISLQRMWEPRRVTKLRASTISDKDTFILLRILKNDKLSMNVGASSSRNTVGLQDPLQGYTNFVKIVNELRLGNGCWDLEVSETNRSARLATRKSFTFCNC